MERLPDLVGATSPVTTTIIRSGPYCRRWKSASSSRVIVGIILLRVLERLRAERVPRRIDGPVEVETRDAVRIVFAWATPASASLFSRSKLVAGNAGWRKHLGEEIQDEVEVTASEFHR